MPKSKITLPKKRGRKPASKPAQTTPAKTEPALKKKPETPETLKGFKDVLPLDAPYWRFVEETAQKMADLYGFKMMRTPVLEPLALFKRTLGKYTDVVEKELFEFNDKANNAVVLRPEGTAGIARSYINHGMHNLPQPVKVIYTGPMFRYESPQSGRLRQHYQIGFEVLGSQSPATDAQLLLMGHNILTELGISYTLEINSMGCSQCREAFKEALVEYYRPLRKELCEDCKRRFLKNPIRLLDCKQDLCQPHKEGAPQMVDYLDEECKKHFMEVLEILDELEIPYHLNPFLVRGLDYYTKTVFEFMPMHENKAQSTLIGGGRYDDLIEELGGQPTPNAGMAMGIERLVSRIKDEAAPLPKNKRTEVFIAQLGVEAKKKAMTIFETLRKEGIGIAENFAKDSLKQQLEDANKLKARYVLILGQKELQEKSVLLRDMDLGVQETVDQKKIINELKKKIEAQNNNQDEEDEDKDEK